MVETLETSHTWTPPRRAARRGRRRRSAARSTGQGTPGLVFCHLSHAYADGASLYFTFISRARRGAELEQWRAGQARRLRGDRRHRRHDHPPPRGRPRPRPLHGGRGGGDGPRRAARGQGAARPGRDHEPRQAAARRLALAGFGFFFGGADDRAGDRCRGGRRCRCRSGAFFSFVALASDAFRVASSVRRDVDLVEGFAGEVGRALRSGLRTWAPILPVVADRGRGQRQHFLRRLGEPDRVGLAFRGRLQAFGFDLQGQRVFDPAEDRDALGVAAVDGARGPPGSAFGFVAGADRLLRRRWSLRRRRRRSVAGVIAAADQRGR